MQPILHLANGRFLLYRPLGSGGYGSVYEALDQAEQRWVAIKLYHPNVQVDQVLLEGQIHVRLSQHPNVADIYHIGFDGPAPYLSLRLLRGGSAEGKLVAGQVNLQEAVAWTRSILAALQHAHDLGVLHRDLRLSNLLFDEAGNAYLTDFGISEDALRKQATAIAYPPHQSPEFIEGKPSTVQTEIWQAGCFLYRLLTGERPFGPKPTRADLKDSGPPRSIQSLNAQVPLQLARVVRRALRIDPANRFPTAHAMHEAIAACEIRASWVPVPGTTDAWHANIVEGELVVQIEQRPRAGPVLIVTRDLGKGPRAVLRRGFGSLNPARQAAGEVMRRVVKDGSW
jgi:eukaryotic-like serine/threonine-protein kinase